MIVGFLIFLALAERFLLDFYQETVADKWALYGIIPVLLFAFVYLVWHKISKQSKNQNREIVRSIIYATIITTIIGAIYIFQISVVISGSIILLNTLSGQNSKVVINGTVIEKSFLSEKDGKFQRIKILVDGDILVLNTNSVSAMNYEKGSYFNEELERGALGLLTKCK